VNRSHSNVGAQAQNAIVDADPAVSLYIRDLATRRGNAGIVSQGSIHKVHEAVKAFLRYVDIELAPNALAQLVQYKRKNPQSTDIELQVKSFSLELPTKSHSDLAARIQGIFRANFALLQVRVNTHAPPTAENITRGIFREIYTKLTQEQQDMIQWGTYVPERAKSAYRIPLTDIDLSRNDFAIVHIAGERPNANGIRSKMRVSHPGLPPIGFARRVVAAAQRSGRNCPFPNHESLWKQITAFARDEYKVRLVSNYTRKYFEDAADDSRLTPSIAAFILGDKTKLAATGHIPLVYNPKLRAAEIERLIQDYAQSGITEALTLPRS